MKQNFQKLIILHAKQNFQKSPKNFRVGGDNKNPTKQSTAKQQNKKL
jgi:hypothetical protein